MTVEYTTTKGATVIVGQLYRDARDRNVRTLRVDAIHEPYSLTRPDERQVDYTVVLVDGQPPKKPRGKDMTAKRIASTAFRLLTGDELAAAQAHISELEAEHD